MDRSPRAATPGRNSPSPISQSASAAVCSRSRCLTQAAKTSDMDSFSAPGLALVGEPAVYWVTACTNSCARTSTGFVKRSKTRPSPSPSTSWRPSQKALS